MSQFILVIDTDENLYVATVNAMQIKTLSMAIDQGTKLSAEKAEGVAEKIKQLISCDYVTLVKATEKAKHDVLIRVRKNPSTLRFNLNDVEDVRADVAEEIDWNSALKSYSSAVW